MNKEQRSLLLRLKSDLRAGAFSVVDRRQQGGLDAAPYVVPDDVIRLLADAIKIPALRTSVNSRSKRAENQVARYLWGPDALRNWQDREDIRNDERRVVGEVKNLSASTVFSRGGPWEVLKDAIYQVTDVIHDMPELKGYAPFSVLFVPRTKIERALVMFPGRIAVGLVQLICTPLEKYRELHVQADVQDYGARWSACQPQR